MYEEIGRWNVPRSKLLAARFRNDVVDVVHVKGMHTLRDKLTSAIYTWGQLTTETRGQWLTLYYYIHACRQAGTVL